MKHLFNTICTRLAFQSCNVVAYAQPDGHYYFTSGCKVREVSCFVMCVVNLNNQNNFSILWHTYLQCLYMYLDLWWCVCPGIKGKTYSQSKHRPYRKSLQCICICKHVIGQDVFTKYKSILTYYVNMQICHWGSRGAQLAIVRLGVETSHSVTAAVTLTTATERLVTDRVRLTFL